MSPRLTRTAVAGLLAVAPLTGCEQPVEEAASPLAGLRTCGSEDEVIGVFIGQSTTSSPTAATM